MLDPPVHDVVFLHTNMRVEYEMPHISGRHFGRLGHSRRTYAQTSVAGGKLGSELKYGIIVWFVYATAAWCNIGALKQNNLNVSSRQQEAWEEDSERRRRGWQAHECDRACSTYGEEQGVLLSKDNT